jgi:hypothetical protein
MPKGGARQHAGRKPGVPNKATRAVKEIAQPYTAAATPLRPAWLLLEC